MRNDHLEEEELPFTQQRPKEQTEDEDEELIMAVERLEEEEELLLQMQYPFRSISLEKIFQHIESAETGDTEKVSFFVRNARGPLLNWWSELTRKPSSWKDLKRWLREDMKSISEAISEGRHHIDQEDLFTH